MMGGAAAPPIILRSVGGSESGIEVGIAREIHDKVRRAARTMGEILYGMALFDWVSGMRRERGDIERFFVLITFGDMVGVPVLPPYYTLRLLPYVIPMLNRWKRSLLRERDLTDLVELIEGVD